MEWSQSSKWSMIFCLFACLFVLFHTSMWWLFCFPSGIVSCFECLCWSKLMGTVHSGIFASTLKTVFLLYFQCLYLLSEAFGHSCITYQIQAGNSSRGATNSCTQHSNCLILHFTAYLIWLVTFLRSQDIPSC